MALRRHESDMTLVRPSNSLMRWAMRDSTLDKMEARGYENMADT